MADRQLHLKCSGGTMRRINNLIAATRADQDAGMSMDPDIIHEHFEATKSRFTSFIADLEYRVSQK